MRAINYFFWGLQGDEPDADRLSYLEDLTLRLRSEATAAGFGSISEAVRDAVARRAIREQGIGE